MLDEGSKNLPVPLESKKSYFSLEMTPSGVSLHLERAGVVLSGGPIGISGLDLGVPTVTFPFDYTSGPRALRSHLTVLNSVTVEAGFDTIRRVLSGASIVGPDDVLTVEPGAGGGIVIAGTTSGRPFSVRLRFVRGTGHNVAILFEYPRIFGLSDIPWSRISSSLLNAVSGISTGHAQEIGVVRPVLKPLMAGLGFKIPLMDGLVLVSTRVGSDRVCFDFSAAADRLSGADQAGDFPADAGPVPEISEPSEVLARLAAGEGSPGATLEFIGSGVSSPILWPEVLARSVALGNEHPELVSVLLAAVLIGAENPAWIGRVDLLQMCRRLLTAAGKEGCRAEVARCAVLVAGVVDRFDPDDALDILNDIRSAGFETREVLEAVAITFDRLDRHFDASTTRLRALAMVPANGVADAIRSMVDRMDVNGFTRQTTGWLDELAGLGAGGRFGAASAVVGRTAVILGASRDAVSSRPGSRDGLRRLLSENPGDPEILELMLTLATAKHEIAEVVELFRSAAELAEGRARCDLLLVAGRAMYERFGLRRRAAEMLESALKADPGCREAAGLLDSIYASLGRAAERVGLASRRLDGCRDLAEKTEILTVMVNAACAAGMYDQAASAVKALLGLDPANLDYLKIAERIYSESGDQDALREVREAIEDISGVVVSTAVPAVRDLDAALAAGDLDAAIDCVRASSVAAATPAQRVELLLQGADLCVLAGKIGSASEFLVAAAGIDPVAALQAATGAVVSDLSGGAAEALDMVMEVARVPSGTDGNAAMAGILLSAAERCYDRSLPVSRALLETALMLDSVNGSVVMALAAVYEGLGMKPESEALLGKV